MQTITKKWAKETSGVLQRSATCLLIKQGGNFLATMALKQSVGKLVAGTLAGMVTAFGAAGTGTAISTLSGAAAKSALLAWFGGGSMLIGGYVVLPAIAAASGWMFWKAFIKGVGRDPNDLTEEEKALFHRCWAFATLLKGKAEKKAGEKLNLSPEQIADIKQLNADMRHYLRDDGCQIQIARSKIKRNHAALSKLLAQLS